MSRLDEIHKKYSDSFNSFTEPAEQRANWFEVYLSKEKQFERAVKQIDEKMNLMLRSFGEFENRLLKKIEYLEDKIDYSNE
jgi:hypothetical protein